MNPSTGLGPIALASAGLVNLAEASKSSRNIIFSAALCVVAVLAIQLRGKLTNFPEAPMRSCYGPRQRHMRNLANLEKRLKAPELRCS
jgi:hypothetical protein